jgi:hypothetical protein
VIVDVTKVRIVEDVVYRALEGEMVLLNLRTGVYFGLDGVGTRIWQLLEEGCTVAQISEQLADEYDVAAAACEQDVRAFMSALRDNALVEPEHPPAH